MYKAVAHIGSITCTSPLVRCSGVEWSWVAEEGKKKHEVKSICTEVETVSEESNELGDFCSTGRAKGGK